MLRHRSRSLYSPRNHRQDTRRCRDYKFSDERPVDAFSSPTRSPRQQRRLQGRRQTAAARNLAASGCHGNANSISAPRTTLRTQRLVVEMRICGVSNRAPKISCCYKYNIIWGNKSTPIHLLATNLASPASGLAQDESFSSKWSSSVPKIAAAAMVRRARSLQQGYVPSPIGVHMRTPASSGQSRALPASRAGATGNTLRRCLTNNTWTTCRLLIVKGNLATVVCDGRIRQLAFDTLAKYDVCKSAHQVLLK